MAEATIAFELKLEKGPSLQVDICMPEVVAHPIIEYFNQPDQLDQLDQLDPILNAEAFLLSDYRGSTLEINKRLRGVANVVKANLIITGFADFWDKLVAAGKSTGKVGVSNISGDGPGMYGPIIAMKVLGRYLDQTPAHNFMPNSRALVVNNSPSTTELITNNYSRYHVIANIINGENGVRKTTRLAEAPKLAKKLAANKGTPQDGQTIYLDMENMPQDAEVEALAIEYHQYVEQNPELFEPLSHITYAPVALSFCVSNPINEDLEIQTYNNHQRLMGIFDLSEIMKLRFNYEAGKTFLIASEKPDSKSDNFVTILREMRGFLKDHPQYSIHAASSGVFTINYVINGQNYVDFLSPLASQTTKQGNTTLLFNPNEPKLFLSSHNVPPACFEVNYHLDPATQEVRVLIGEEKKPVVKWEEFLENSLPSFFDSRSLGILITESPLIPKLDTPTLTHRTRMAQFSNQPINPVYITDSRAVELNYAKLALESSASSQDRLLLSVLVQFKEETLIDEGLAELLGYSNQVELNEGLLRLAEYGLIQFNTETSPSFYVSGITRAVISTQNLETLQLLFRSDYRIQASAYSANWLAIQQKLDLILGIGNLDTKAEVLSLKSRGFIELAAIVSRELSDDNIEDPAIAITIIERNLSLGIRSPYSENDLNLLITRSTSTNIANSLSIYRGSLRIQLLGDVAQIESEVAALRTIPIELTEQHVEMLYRAMERVRTLYDPANELVSRVITEISDLCSNTPNLKAINMWRVLTLSPNSLNNDLMGQRVRSLMDSHRQKVEQLELAILINYLSQKRSVAFETPILGYEETSRFALAHLMQFATETNISPDVLGRYLSNMVGTTFANGHPKLAIDFANISILNALRSGNLMIIESAVNNLTAIWAYSQHPLPLVLVTAAIEMYTQTGPYPVSPSFSSGDGYLIFKQSNSFALLAVNNPQALKAILPKMWSGAAKILNSPYNPNPTARGEIISDVADLIDFNNGEIENILEGCPDNYLLVDIVFAIAKGRISDTVGKNILDFIMANSNAQGLFPKLASHPSSMHRFKVILGLNPEFKTKTLVSFKALIEATLVSFRKESSVRFLPNSLLNRISRANLVSRKATLITQQLISTILEGMATFYAEITTPDDDWLISFKKIWQDLHDRETLDKKLKIVDALLAGSIEIDLEHR